MLKAQILTYGRCTTGVEITKIKMRERRLTGEHVEDHLPQLQLSWWRNKQNLSCCTIFAKHLVL